MTYEEKREIEKQEERDFQEIIKKVAPLLMIHGFKVSEWKYEASTNGNDRAYLVGPGTAKLWVKWDCYHKRIEISSLYPNGHGQFSCKHFYITVSPKKDPAKIASDIERRLLPEYLPELDRVLTKMKQTENYEAGKKASMKKVSDFLNTPIHENGNIYLDGKPVYCIKPYSSDSVEFEVKCTPEKAIEVLKILQEA